MAENPASPSVVLTPAPGEDLTFIATYPAIGDSGSEGASTPSNRFGPAEISSAAVFVGAALAMTVLGLITTQASRRRARLGIAKPLKLSLR